MYTVMLVDDEPLILEGLALKVDWAALGFTICQTAQNGRQALEALERKRVDLVITDIRMPGLGGIELIGQLYHSYPQLKILILSGYDEFSYAKKAMEFGVMGYLLKPVSREELTSHLERVRAQLDAERPVPPSAARREAQLPEVMSEIIDYIDTNFSNDLSLKQISSRFYLNTAYLGQLFKKYLGENFNDYLNKRRIRAVKELLVRRDLSISEIIQQVGYKNPAYFYMQFKRYEGRPFKDYRQQE